MVQRIPLSGKRGAGLYALVDDEDTDLVSRYTWHLYESKSKGKYARTSVRNPDGKLRKVMMSHLITGQRWLDHRNRDGLDNTRGNLRRVTPALNRANSAKRHRSSTSRFKGVSWHRGNRHWEARATYRGKAIRCGTFTSEEQAARAYDKTAEQLWGPFARTNVALGLLPPVI